MTHMRKLIWCGVMALMMIVSMPSDLWAQSCKSPGDTVTITLRGHDLQVSDRPTILAKFPSTTLKLRVTSTQFGFEGSRTVVTIVSLLPMVGVPYNTTAEIVIAAEQDFPAHSVGKIAICPAPNEPGDEPKADLSDLRNSVLSADRARRAKVPFRKATRNQVAAPSGAPEYLLVGDARDMNRARAVLLRLGVSVLRSQSLGAMGKTMLAVDLGGVVSEAQLRADLARAGISVTLDKHAVYQASAVATDAKFYAQRLTQAAAPAGCGLSRPVRIGVIDGPVDSGNPALDGVRFRQISVLDQRERIGSSDHATGIVSLIAGTPTAKGGGGFARGASILSTIAFARAGGRDVAQLENIAVALDWLLQQKAEVVNMSLAGPPNQTLAELVKIADAKGLILIAAAGNAGRSTLAFPAADPRVISVTAVDAARRLYRRASYGPGLDVAAPGVDVFVATRRGGGYRSGTSYAAAIVTGMVAQMKARNRGLRRADAQNALKKQALDLGPKGYDPKFGWGLAQMQNCAK